MRSKRPAIDTHGLSAGSLGVTAASAYHTTLFILLQLIDETTYDICTATGQQLMRHDYSLVKYLHRELKPRMTVPKPPPLLG